MMPESGDPQVQLERAILELSELIKISVQAGDHDLVTKLDGVLRDIEQIETAIRDRVQGLEESQIKTA